MATHIHIHLPSKTKDANASTKVRNHSQFTQADYDYLHGKGYSDSEILKRWDEEKKQGKAPMKVNKSAKYGETGYDSSLYNVKDASSVASIEKDIKNQEFLIAAAEKQGKMVQAGQLGRRLKFLKEELEKAKVATNDTSSATFRKGDIAEYQGKDYIVGGVDNSGSEPLVYLEEKRGSFKVSQLKHKGVSNMYRKTIIR